MIYRASKDYIPMCIIGLRDKRLSLSAKGLLAYLLSYPDGCNVWEDALVENFVTDLHTISKALEDLEKYGYVKRTAMLDENGVCKLEYEVFEMPKETE